MRNLPPRKRVLLIGATGTAGRGVAAALVAARHDVAALVRPSSATTTLPPGLRLRFGDPTDLASLRRDAFSGERYDAVISCLASRTGAPRDAWAIDHDAHLSLLRAATEARAGQFILVSAICVQKPRLDFQFAKLAFEERLQASGLTWSIVRPTALFKSLSGQIARVRAGKPYLLFGDGRLTACKPISDRDLGGFVVRCLTDPAKRNAILPVGGPGPALTPRDMGETLFRLLGRPPRFRRVPLTFMRGVTAGLGLAGRISSRMADKAEFARIGLYYATESMLVWNAEIGRYDADATPSFGRDTLEDHYARVLSGAEKVELGDHAVF